MPPVQAHRLGLAGATLEGKTRCSTDWVWPCAGSLAMGHSWSLCFAQSAVDRCCSMGPLLREAGVWHDHGLAPVFSRSQGSCLGRYTYMDTAGVAGACEASVRAGLQEAIEGLDAARL